MDTGQALHIVDGLMRTEAELDAWNVEQRQKERAEALQPLPQLVDLFGEQIEPITRRRMKSRRRETKGFARRVLEFGVTPQDVLYRYMLRAVERDNREEAIRLAAILLPYSLPRLAAMTVAAAPGGGSGALSFAWEEARTVDENHDSLRTPVVSAPDS